MLSTFLVAATAALARVLAAGRLARWNIGTPLVMIVAGAAAGLFIESAATAVLNTEVAQHAAEIVLAVLLFVDATELRPGRLLGDHPGLAGRLLLVALPLGLGAAVLLGLVLLPGLPWAVLLVLACVVIPTDFAPAEDFLSERSVSDRVRSTLNVEGGYNDGIISPIFLFALVLAGDRTQERTPLEALETAVPAAVKAGLGGLVVGFVVAWVLHRVERSDVLSAQSLRIAVLLTPLLAYAATVGIGGNGFVASFVCGVVFRAVRTRLDGRVGSGDGGAQADFGLLRDMNALLTMAMWFVVGIAAVLTVSFGISWRIAVYTLAALTVLRIGPVLLALVRSGVPTAQRWQIALVGPRGTTSIVLGLIAYNALPEGAPADSILTATVLCVLVSALVHGPAAAPLARRLEALSARVEPASRPTRGAP